jgi:hypothetical protein
MWIRIAPSRHLADFPGAITAIAEAVHKDDVIDHAKARRNHFFEVLNASIKLKQPAALQTMKVVMMGLATDFIARRRPRHCHWHQPSLIGESLYGAINRRHTQSGYLLLRKPQHLVRC